MKDDVITRISNETMYDDTQFGLHQIRPCLRGRSVRWKTYNPDRLKYPLLRTGKREKASLNGSVGMKRRR